MRYPLLMAVTSLVLVAAGPAKPTPTGDAKDPKKDPEKPIPKVTSVSPAFAVTDSNDYQVTLRGTDLKGTGVKIRYETDPSQGLHTCDVVGEVTDTEVTCKLKATDVADGEPYHFSVTWKKKDELVVGPSSTATFTVREPLAAAAVCFVQRAEETQVRVRAAGIDKDTKVQFTAPTSALLSFRLFLTTFVLGNHLATTESTFTCTDPTIVGDQDVVCFLPVGVATQLPKYAWVQLLRKNEHQVASAKTASKLELTDTPDVKKARNLYELQGCFSLTR